MRNKFYLTTAIPYVNAKPHVGHALEFVQADAIARFRRIIGDDVLYAAGSDENSLKNVRAAESEGISTQLLVDKYAKSFDDLREPLNLSYDTFNRTSSDEHATGAQKLWLACKQEDIYKKSYTGLYCVGCEEFYTQEELVEGKCPEHKVEPEEVSEENYFFKLSNYQQQLLDLIDSGMLQITPETRKNEVVSFIKQGLRDFSISRSVARAKGWGVVVPNDPTQIMYVWFDALTTYLTSLGYGTDEERFNTYWENGDIRLHMIGKGIIRFHAVYWVAMLLSAGIKTPTHEFVHGYVTVEGQKISKSLGNTIDPVEVVQKYGTDVLRYYLLREIPAYGDGDFSERRLHEIYSADLANGLGNLVARVARLCERTGQTGVSVTEFSQEAKSNLEKFSFDHALAAIWEHISQVDKAINTDKPWTLEDEELETKLAGYVKEIAQIAFDLQPFMPSVSQHILQQYSAEKVTSQNILFPRL